MSIYATYREHGHSGAVLPASDRIVSTNLVRAAAGTPRLAGIATEGNRAGMSRTDRERSLPNIHARHDGRPTVMTAFISSSSGPHVRNARPPVVTRRIR